MRARKFAYANVLKITEFTRCIKNNENLIYFVFYVIITTCWGSKCAYTSFREDFIQLS